MPTTHPESGTDFEADAQDVGSTEAEQVTPDGTVSVLVKVPSSASEAVDVGDSESQPFTIEPGASATLACPGDGEVWAQAQSGTVSIEYWATIG